jgi:hypothetical protein
VEKPTKNLLAFKLFRNAVSSVIAVYLAKLPQETEHFVAIKLFASAALGCQMIYAIFTTVFGRNVTLFASFGKLAAPRLTNAAKTAGQTLVPTVEMLPTRRGCHRLSLLLGFYAQSVSFPTNVHTESRGDRFSKALDKTAASGTEGTTW